VVRAQEKLPDSGSAAMLTQLADLVILPDLGANAGVYYYTCIQLLCGTLIIMM
jgi:hypothetical protein